jgi:hypothetical protein
MASSKIASLLISGDPGNLIEPEKRKKEKAKTDT